MTKLKHVKRELESDDFSLPTPLQQIVRVVSSKGNNLHEVEPADSTTNFLVSMPPKFRKNVWIKRGNYVLVDMIDEGDKVKAELVRVLTDEHTKEFTKHGVWPKKFTNKREHKESDSDNDNIAQGNPNRHATQENTDTDDSSSSDN